ncbi:MAG: hypothetical protein QOI95_100 [Acidimicrobiaceae bacterium]|jgi:uncharacterized protein (TIGR03083 family)
MTTSPPAGRPGEEISSYLHAHKMFLESLASTSDTLPVPACPGWDVHDLVAHQVHQLRAACEGDFPVLDSMAAISAPDPDERARALARQEKWIASGLQERRATSVGVLIAQWETIEADAPAIVLAALAPDIAVHLFDLLGASGSTSHRDDPIVVAALRFWAPFAIDLVQREAKHQLCLLVDSGQEPREAIGDGGAEFVVAGTPFELLRTVTGRRSIDQAVGLTWKPRNDDVIERFSVYGWRPGRLDE